MNDKEGPKDGRSQAQDSDSGKKSKGQRRSKERGSATNHKKNPGKRAHKGGS